MEVTITLKDLHDLNYRKTENFINFVDVIDKFIKYLESEMTASVHTVKAYRCDLMQFARWLTGDKPEDLDVRSVTMQDIRAWLGTLARQGLTPRSLRRKLLSVRSFFRYLRKSELIPVNPATDVDLPKLPRSLPKFIPQREMELIVGREAFETDDFTTFRNKLIIDILYSTGIRRSELLGLRDEDISLTAGEIKVHGKRRKDRIIPIPEQLCERIKNYKSMREALWPGCKGAFLLSGKGRPLNNEALSSIVKIELGSSSAARKTPHVLRHSCATALLREGAEINSVKELLGHSSLATTQIYTHLSFSELQHNYKQAHPRAKKN